MRISTALSFWALWLPVLFVGAPCGSSSGQGQGRLSSAPAGVGRPTSGGLSIEPGIVDFGTVRVGERGTTLRVAIRNEAAEPVTVHGLSFVGPEASDFVLGASFADSPSGAGRGDRLNEVLSPGEVLRLALRFRPTAMGLRSATLRIECDTPETPAGQLVRLVGIGLGPHGDEARANAGGPGFVDGAGRSWSRDFGASGGVFVRRDEEIDGTTDDVLFRSIRSGPAFTYAFALPEPGPYLVRLGFVGYDGTPGEDVFDVQAESQPLLQGFDVRAVAGLARAHTESFAVDVRDGRLDLSFVATSGLASVAAVEVFSLPQLVPVPDHIAFGAVSAGGRAQSSLQLTNSGLVPLTITAVGWRLGGSGNGQAFSLALGGRTFDGAPGDIVHPTSLAIGVGASSTGTVTFSPTSEQYDSVLLELTGTFGTATVPISGLGGHAGDPFLHVVIDAPEWVVDYEGDGFEPVTLDGTGSHTHEPGHAVTDFSWSFDGGGTISTNPLITPSLALGDRTVTLRIQDDSVPPRSLSDSKVVEVRSRADVPGVLARYYDASASSASALLDAVPANASFAEYRDELSVTGLSLVGGSPFSQNVMVRLVADIEIETTGLYQLRATGGVDRRLLVDRVAHSSAVTLTSGRHLVEARFAVDEVGQIPLDVSISVEGGAFVPIAATLLTHDETSMRPVLNEMPATGTTLGGNLITIDGLGFFPTTAVVVHWGATRLTQSSFTSITASEISFASPPGTGAISVTVETPNGTSNARTFQYDASGPVPIVFANTRTWGGIPNPTATAWGPDGRLYIASLDGRITALTFDTDWTIQRQATYPGVSGLANHDTLGITFNPYDPPSPVKVYLGHGTHFVNGGSSFTGPSPYTGQVSVLTGPNFDTPVPLITQLPTSNHDHAINGLEFDHNGDLLICVGSNTNAGVKHPASGDLPESPLSAAIVRARTSKAGFNGAIVYVETATGIPNTDQVYGERVDVQAGVDIEVFAPGLRNPYDVVLTTRGRIYATDNGPNTGFGAASTGPSTEAPDPYDVDELNLVEYQSYYGSPNRSRGRYDARQNVYQPSSEGLDIPGQFSQSLVALASSSNGIDEYRADTFQGQMRGDLIVQKWVSQPRRVQLSDDGRDLEALTTIYPWTGGLSLITGPGGVLIATDYGNSQVRLLEPDDASARGLVVFDVFPWRARPEGGGVFQIGGVGFGSLANTSVQIGGLNAALTSVSPTRIVGTIPQAVAPTTALLDVRVTVSGSSDVLAGAFRYLLGQGLEPGRWEGHDQVPQAIGEVAAGVVNGVLFVVGEGASPTFAFDLLDRVWLPNRPGRPFQGHHHAAEVVNGKLYLIGGLGGNSEGKVQIYDPVANVWTQGASMTWAGGSVSTAAIGGKIYAAGGIVGTSTVTNVAVYDPVANTWTAKAAMPLGRNHAAGGTDGTRMFVFGGRTGGNFVTNGFDDVQIYDPVRNTWVSTSDPGSTLARLPQARGGMGHAVWYQGEFYVMGGETLNGPGATPSNVYARVDVYNPTTNRWRLDADMPTPRHGIYPVLFQSRIFVAGGGIQAANSQSRFFDEFLRF